jgi:hypothetical protein
MSKIPAILPLHRYYEKLRLVKAALKSGFFVAQNESLAVLEYRTDASEAGGVWQASGIRNG